jgi:iron complex outermembrane receptor protein
MRHRRTHFVHSGRRAALLATAALPLLAATPAFAQDAQPEAAPVADTQTAAPDDQAIVVTGLRETIQTSIRTKRDQTAIVDALSSQEIGNIPALSVGEAIQTIAGATTHREKGGASEIALRGLGPFLSNSTFNGRDATNGSGDRAVNFNQFPSELINEIMIYKSQQADLVEGGVAGTIELGTLRPLAFGRQRIQAEFKANYSPQQNNVYGDDGIGWRGTISYVDQFELGDAGEFGIALGFQRNDTNNPEDTFAASTTWVACDATRTILNNNCSQVTAQQVAEGTPFYLAPNALTYRQISESDRRDAFFGALQWRPDPSLDINIDFQYSDRTFNEQRNDLNLSEGQRAIDNRVIDPAGFLIAYTGQSSIETVSTLLTRSEEYLGGGLNIQYEPTERLTLRADFSYSRTRRVETERSVRQRTDPRDIFGNPTPINNQRIPYSYELGDGFAPTITIDPRFDVNNWDLFSDDTRIRRDENSRENEIIAGRFDAVYDLDDPFLRSLHAGVRYSRQTYNDYDDRVEININDAAQEREANLACRVPFQQRGYLNQVPGAIHSWATFDPLCLFQQHLGTEDPGRNADIRSVANRDVTEEVWAGYVMASYATDEDVPLPISGNVGLRVVNTSVTSNGLRSALDVVTNPDGSIRLVESGDFDTVTIENATTRFLPSANVTFHLQNDLLLRFAVYKAMSRPAPSSLGAGRTITLADGTDFDSIEEAVDEIRANGSPRLEPLMSWNYDASLEYYLNRDSLFSAAVYYKQFNGGFIPIVTDEQFTIGGQDVTIPVVQTANSSERSRIYGLELTLTHRFSWLPAPFDGLGARLTYTYANSNFENQDIRLGEIFNPATGGTTPGIIPPANLSGFSENVVSAQAYYQKGPLSLQAVYNYRSDYYQDFVGGNNQLRYVRGNDTFDLRASYQFTPNVSVSFEAVNIFDEPKVTDMPVPGSIRQYHYYGPRYFLGVRVRI